MINITFKEVGQGDTIILEYENKGKKVGIIDCKKTTTSNPAVEYLIETEPEEITFLLLSHPHLDHLSGFISLINHCIDNDIKIKRFFHTSERVPEYLETAGKTNKILEDNLIILYDKVEELRKAGTHVCFLSAYDADDNLNAGRDVLGLNPDEGMFMKILAPRVNEYNKYSSKVGYKWDEEGENGHPDANWLSTVLKISVGDHYVLLTSDSSKQVFIDFLHEANANKRKDFEGKLALAQVPHHGSKSNFYKGFWKKVKTDKSKAIISVGQNNYKHPSEKVRDLLIGMRYDLYSTGQVGCLLGDTSVLDSISLSLDAYNSYALSTGNTVSKLHGQKTFVLTKDNCYVA